MKTLPFNVLITVLVLSLASVSPAETAEEKLVLKPYRDLIAHQPIELEEAQQRGRMVDRELSRYGVSYRVGIETKQWVAKKDQLREGYLQSKESCNREYDCLLAAQNKYEAGLTKIHAEIAKVEERAKKENELAESAALATYRSLIGAVAFNELQKELTAQAPAKGLVLETDLMLTFLNDDTGSAWFNKVTDSFYSTYRSGMQYTGATLFARTQELEYRVAVYGQLVVTKDNSRDLSLQAYRNALMSSSNLNTKEIFAVSRKLIVSDLFDTSKVAGKYDVQCLGMDPKKLSNPSFYCFSNVVLNTVRLR
jgi:hypothetical protein